MREVELIRTELTPKLILIDPQSVFMRRWDISMIVALFLTAIVTPFEVSFLRSSTYGDPVDALFIFNRVLDVVFIYDILMNFFIKIEVTSGPMGKRTLRTRAEIARYYIKTWFLIDVVSVLPFGLVSWILGSEQISRYKDSLFTSESRVLEF